jgi:lipoprotein-anchoring transpeptidase ErfK/SrfK
MGVRRFLVLLVLVGAGCGTVPLATHHPKPPPPPRPVVAAAAPEHPMRPAPEAVVAVVRWRLISVRTAPGPTARARWVLTNPNSLGAPLVFLVHRLRAGWAQVDVPARPNESTGWIPVTAISLRLDPYRIVVSESRHLLTLYDRNRVRLRYPVGVGSPASPTPTGSFYLTELLQADASGPYGPYAYGTSAFSNVYQEFEGGPGQIGLHGTDEPWSIGASISHGCVRMYDADVTVLAHIVPVGTPLLIVR